MIRQLFVLLVCSLGSIGSLYAGPAEPNSSSLFNGLQKGTTPTSFLVTHNGSSNNSSHNTAYFNLREPLRVETPPRRESLTPIHILQSDMVSLMQVGKFERLRLVTPATSVMMNIGTADNVNPQTWTMPSGLLSLTAKVFIDYFVDPMTIMPVSARVSGATHATKTALRDVNLNPITRYKHYKLIDGDELDEMGETFDYNGTVTDYSEMGRIYVDAPLDLGDTYQTDITSHNDENALPKSQAINDVTVDGFGAITTPYGTFDCLRMSITQTENIYTVDPNTPNSTVTRYFVGWVTKEGFQFYARKPAIGSTGMVSLDNLQITDMNNVSTLPVELLSFDAETNGKTVDVTWTTASERNNAGFDIERGNDGKTFEKIGFVKGSGTTSDKQRYTFTDNTPLSTTAYYRLQQVDFDGSSVSSNIIAIESKNKAKGVKIYPNPSKDGLISIEIPQNTEGVSIVNAVGQTVFQQQTKGNNLLKLDVSAWTSGVYFVKSGNDVVTFVKN